MTVITDWAGKETHRSRNLRGLLTHARRTCPIEATLEPCAAKPGFYVLTVEFANGDTGVDMWADWRVAADWLVARRSWPRLAVAGYAPFVNRYEAAIGRPLSYVFGLMVRPRPYVCIHCGTESTQSTNHTGKCAAYCKGCSWTPNRHPIAMHWDGRAYRAMRYTGGPVHPYELNPHSEQVIVPA